MNEANNAFRAFLQKLQDTAGRYTAREDRASLGFEVETLMSKHFVRLNGLSWTANGDKVDFLKAVQVAAGTNFYETITVEGRPIKALKEMTTGGPRPRENVTVTDSLWKPFLLFVVKAVAYQMKKRINEGKNQKEIILSKSTVLQFISPAHYGCYIDEFAGGDTALKHILLASMSLSRLIWLFARHCLVEGLFKKSAGMNLTASRGYQTAFDEMNEVKQKIHDCFDMKCDCQAYVDLVEGYRMSHGTAEGAVKGVTKGLFQ